jgi:predicted MPP superfamily phosphohydrolase
MTGPRFWQSSPFDVPLLRTLAARARRPREELGEATNGTADDALPGRIRLRTFAGAAAHAQQLAVPLRVVHLTDIHVGRVTPMRVQRAAVDLTNAQKPDLIVITGDFVCHSQEYLDALEEIVGSLKAPVVGVMGNHDHWSGANEVRRALRRARAEVLDNSHTVLTLRGQRLQLVGLDDAYTGHADAARAVRGLRKNLPVLGLSHIAEEADGLWNRGVPLVLSGHTHAGQVTLAGLHELAMGRFAGHKYVHGLYGTRTPGDNTPKGAVYVGAGIGASVMPLRLGERGRREVTVFEIGAAPGSIDERMEEQLPLPGRPPTPEQKRKRAAKVLKKAARRARMNLRRELRKT